MEIARGRACWLAAAGLAVFGSACGIAPPRDAETCGDGQPALEIRGRPREPFVPIEDGDRVFVRCGGQGLRHVEIQIVGRGLDPVFRFTAALSDSDSGEPFGGISPSRWFTFQDSLGTCVSPELYLIVGPPPSAMANRIATLDVRVDDEAGRRLAASRRVVVDTTMMGCAM